MDNGIFNRQCTKENQIKILAIKNLDMKAKNLVKLQIFMITLPVIVAAFLVLIRNNNYELSLIPPLLGFIVTILNFTKIFPQLSKIRTEVAKIHQDYDCSVLKLPWNHIKLDKIDLSYIRSHLDEVHDFKRVKPCYPPVIDEVPLSVARVICQRKFLGGEGKVRRKFILFVNFLMGLSFVLSLIFAVANSLNIFQFLGNLVLPFLPALIFTIKLIQDNSNSIKRALFLKKKLESIWDKVLLNDCEDDKLRLVSLRIQDELFEKRKVDPIILDYFFDKLRDSLGDSHYSAELMVSAYLSKNR